MDYSSDEIELSDSGKYYFNNLIMTFEYLTNIFLDTYIFEDYVVELKSYSQYTQFDKWQILINFANYIHDRIVLELKTNSHMLSKYYFVIVENCLYIQPQFRILECLFKHIDNMRAKDLENLKIRKDKKAEMINIIYERANSYIQDFNRVIDKDKNPNFYVAPEWIRHAIK